VKEPEG